jgi:hypothetical protein
VIARNIARANINGFGNQVTQVADELRALAGAEVGGEYYVLAGYFDAEGDFMHATMWANSDWATDSGYTIPCYIKQERTPPPGSGRGGVG